MLNLKISCAEAALSVIGMHNAADRCNWPNCPAVVPLPLIHTVSCIIHAVTDLMFKARQ